MVPTPDTIANLRASCPSCETTFAYRQLGLKSAVLHQESTVVCPVCIRAFDTRVEVVTETTAPPWWRIWNRTFVVTESLISRSTLRTPPAA